MHVQCTFAQALFGICYFLLTVLVSLEKENLNNKLDSQKEVNNISNFTKVTCFNLHIYRDF